MKRKLSLSCIKHIDDDGVIHVDKKIDTLDDLINLSNMYIPGYLYNIDLYRLQCIHEPLIKLNKTIGLEKIKKDIIKHILFFLQDFQGANDDMLHTVIQGAPGVGKTMVAQIIGEIYWKLGIINSGINNDYKFKIVKRSDLIGQYLGTTAKKTQEVIDSCIGGVMFIDEAYSLGNEEKRDIYAKECIDTINQNLTEKKGEFICIIAGYEKDLDKCFFAYNPGLRRRFPFVYTIDKYSHEDLSKIFRFMIIKDKWQLNIDSSKLDDIFKNDYDVFVNMAGDIETLVFNCKLEHSTRVFCMHEYHKNKVTEEDLLKAINALKKSRNFDAVSERKEFEKSLMNTLYC
jgi:SpoVK/Ycf46/Vps4 family AAA+-type ATPase